jgi:hypothetical protein
MICLPSYRVVTTRLPLKTEVNAEDHSLGQISLIGIKKTWNFPLGKVYGILDEIKN